MVVFADVEMDYRSIAYENRGEGVRVEFEMLADRNIRKGVAVGKGILTQLLYGLGIEGDQTRPGELIAADLFDLDVP